MAYVIWTLVSCIFLALAWHCRRAKEPVGFFTSEKPPLVKDVTAYNRAVSKLWLVFALLLEAIGLPLAFVGQNDPRSLLVMLAAPLLVIGLMVGYLRILNKHKQ